MPNLKPWEWVAIVAGLGIAYVVVRPCVMPDSTGYTTPNKAGCIGQRIVNLPSMLLGLPDELRRNGVIA